MAFENAFERLLLIIDEEGRSDGGIIVSDCLNLMLTLLRQNPSNQVCRAGERAGGRENGCPDSSLRIGSDAVWLL